MILRSHHNGALVVTGKGTGKDALDSRELNASDFLKSQHVELGTLNIAQLIPEIAPVHVGALGLFLDLSALVDGECEDILVSLLTDDGNVPLQDRDVSTGR